MRFSISSAWRHHDFHVMPEVPSVDSSRMSDLLDAVYPRDANGHEAEDEIASDQGETN